MDCYLYEYSRNKLKADEVIVESWCSMYWLNQEHLSISKTKLIIIILYHKIQTTNTCAAIPSTNIHVGVD